MMTLYIESFQCMKERLVAVEAVSIKVASSFFKQRAQQLLSSIFTLSHIETMDKTMFPICT